MNFYKLSIILTAVMLFAFACGNNPNQPANTTAKNTTNAAPSNATNATNTQTTAPTDELAAAKKKYADTCVKCHKEDGIGGQVEGDDGKFNVPSFKGEKAMKHDETKMFDIIANGDDEMPAFKTKLKPEEIKDLVKFIRKEYQGR
jgi:mono/diheme cytochrome c family protein